MSANPSPFVDSMRDAALALPVTAAEPAWLGAARREALTDFLQTGLPDTRNELWKYTSLRALAQRGYQPSPHAPAPVVEPTLWALPGVAGPRLVFVNGVFRAELSALADLPEGVSLQPLSLALRTRAEPLRFLWGAQAEGDDGFTLLNRALASDGVVLRVAAGVQVTPALHVVQLGVAGAAAAWHLRNWIELGAGASLRLVEHHAGDAGAAHLANLVTAIDLREAAHLDWTLLQTSAAEQTLLRRSDCRLGVDAAIDFHALELGGKLARHELRVELTGARARFSGRGAFVVHDRQHADTEILVTHRGRDTVSDTVWRGVADGRARGVVHGRILVEAGADGADGCFYNKNLLLSPSAEIDTRPALEIYADEVKANHGATVGQLDDNVLFYLRARGIPLELARQLLVRAFCALTLAGIAPAPLREHCGALLAAQLPVGDDA